MVAPARERGLKYDVTRNISARIKSRSREGAWIEIKLLGMRCITQTVAPARERGLKLIAIAGRQGLPRRSREGAWIEIPTRNNNSGFGLVAPARERGLKYA